MMFSLIFFLFTKQQPLSDSVLPDLQKFLYFYWIFSKSTEIDNFFNFRHKSTGFCCKGLRNSQEIVLIEQQSCNSNSCPSKITFKSNINDSLKRSWCGVSNGIASLKSRREHVSYRLIRVILTPDALPQKHFRPLASSPSHCTL